MTSLRLHSHLYACFYVCFWKRVKIAANMHHSWAAIISSNISCLILALQTWVAWWHFVAHLLYNKTCIAKFAWLNAQKKYISQVNGLSYDVV